MVQQGPLTIGIEEKSGARVPSTALAALSTRQQTEGLHLGVVLYMGTEAIALDERTVAVPVDQFFR